MLTWIKANWELLTKISVIAGSLWYGGIKLYKKWVRPSYKWIVELTQAMELAITELSPDSGGSMKDKINKINVTIDTVKGSVEVMRGRQAASFYLNQDPSFECGPNGSLLKANKAFMELTGLDDDSAKGTGWLRCIAKEDRQRVSAQWEDDAKTQSQFDETYKIINPKTKTETIVRGVSFCSRDDKGEITRIFGTVQNIKT